MARIPSSILTLAAFLAASSAFAQPAPDGGNCHPTPDGTGMICDAVTAITEADLANRVYIDKGTFANAPNGGWSRDNVELEGAMNVTCADGQELIKALRTERGGRTTYQRLRRPEMMEAFTVGFGIDEMPWDGDSHRLREQSPNVWLSVEGDRFPQDEATGKRRLSVGTDIMDDVYYDTSDFTLLGNNMSLRGRARWDSPTEIRRLLIGAKIGSGIDEFGLKRAAKIDIRNDGASAADIAALDEAVRSGFTNWGSRAAAQPVREIYERLAKDGKLPDVGSHEDVLLLEPKAYLRSVRSRYHLNEASFDSVLRMYSNGAERMRAVVAQIKATRDAGAIPAGREAEIAALETKLAGILEKTLIAERALPAFQAADPAITSLDVTAINASLPDVTARTLVRNDSELASRKIVAETINALHHEAAADIERLRRDIAGAQGGGNAADEPSRFTAFLKSEKPRDLGKITTVDRFQSLYDATVALPDAERAARITAYNTWAEAQKAGGNRDFRDFQPLDDAAFKAMRPHFVADKLRIWSRQIEASGSAGNGLWFDAAREYYVPDSGRATGNFLIDTMDMTEMYTPDAWASIPPDQRTAGNTLPADKAFHAVLVNELQIELGSEKAYLDRMNVLAEKVKADPNDAVSKKQLEGARFVFEQYKNQLKFLSQIKGDNVLRRMRDAGAPACMEWKDVEMSKGDRALKMIRDAQPNT